MFYDVRFDAIAPKSADSTEQEEVIRLIINVEAQTKFKPGYPLTKRAIYYCSRMISAQHGPIFTKSEYGKIRKVYSIWICTQPSDGFENTLTRYSIKPEQLIGEAQEETENYDLMSVVMICLGKPGTENHKGILKFMEVLLSSTRSGSEKKKILEEEFGVAMSEELEREVLEVCNLSQGVRAEGREEGRQEGRMASTEMGTLDRKRRMAAFWFTVTSEMTSSSLAAFPPRMPATAAASMPFIPSVLGTTTLLTFLMMLLLTPIFTRSGSQPSTSRALAAA